MVTVSTEPERALGNSGDREFREFRGHRKFGDTIRNC